MRVYRVINEQIVKLNIESINKVNILHRKFGHPNENMCGKLIKLSLPNFVSLVNLVETINEPLNDLRTNTVSKFLNHYLSIMDDYSRCT